ncbi:MAG TPA: hypothetical protein VE547_15665 [Mycobacteriales bacterium]|nr:hypothetical protein [Mycobacteriales bacterium]
MLAAAAAVVGLRAGADPVVPAVPVRSPVAQDAPIRPVGPFDHLPGRTPIPAPVEGPDRVGGDLPPTGAPGEAAAIEAVELVLGRYCLRPDRYELTPAPLDGWLSLGVLAVDRERWDDPRLIDVGLIWTGRSYRWAGVPDQLRVC